MCCTRPHGGYAKAALAFLATKHDKNEIFLKRQYSKRAWERTKKPNKNTKQKFLFRRNSEKMQQQLTENSTRYTNYFQVRGSLLHNIFKVTFTRMCVWCVCDGFFRWRFALSVLHICTNIHRSKSESHCNAVAKSCAVYVCAFDLCACVADVMYILDALLSASHLFFTLKWVCLCVVCFASWLGKGCEFRFAKNWTQNTQTAPFHSKYRS